MRIWSVVTAQKFYSFHFWDAEYWNEIAEGLYEGDCVTVQHAGASKQIIELTATSVGKKNKKLLCYSANWNDEKLEC